MVKAEAAGGAEMKTRKNTKKRGRPSLLDLRKGNPNSHNKPPIPKSDPDSTPNLARRSTRRNPNSDSQSSDSDDDERQEKKIMLVVRLPASNSADSDEINASADRSDAADDEYVVKDEKETEALQGSPSEPGPMVPLPDKKLLVFILDRLQKKDTYGVFSEPVDPKELPDYNEIIEHPMDFGTVRRKLKEGSYSNLNNFESDVLLICANAMQYNAPDTVYFRQAKSIQEIAKRDFQNLRQVNDEGQPQPKIVRRGRPPNLLKVLSNPALDRVGHESSSDATLATAGDNSNNNNNNNDNNNNAVGSNSYNLRKGLAPFKFQYSDAFFRDSPQYRNSETNADYTADWNSEFPAKILKAEAKHAKKQFTADENRRATYKDLSTSALGHDTSSLTTLNRNMKQLIGVGLQSEQGYAKSLARFAANLGPVVWKIASKKIERALPSGVKFGPGWVGENEALPSTSSIHDNNSHHQSVPGNIVSRMGPATKHLLHNPNGFNHVSGYDSSSQSRNLATEQQSSSQEAHPTAQTDSTPEQNVGVSSNKGLNMNISVAPDLNVRFQAPGSPNSSFRIGSPQPDLALQLS